MKSIIRNIIILAVVAGLGFAGYKFFFAKKAAPSTGGIATTSGVGATNSSQGTAATTGASAASNSVGQDFLTLLLSVQSIRLDDSIFQSKAFDNLQDFNRPIPPDTNPGRPNPFAPLGTDGALAGAVVSTSNPSSVSTASATLNGTLSTTDGQTTRWFEYGTTQSLGIMTSPMLQTTPGAFAESIKGLTANTTYYVRASALVGNQTVSGNIVTWKTAQGGTR